MVLVQATGLHGKKGTTGGIVANVIAKLKHEFLGMIPTAIFFFVSFQLLALTRSLILEEYGIDVTTFLAATIGALVVAKVVMIVDLLPFVNRYPEKPLIYNVVWKTTLYVLAALVVRFVEHFVDFYHQYGDAANAYARLMDDVIWAHFLVVQIWLTVLFLMYCSFRELTRVVGQDSVRQLFFSPPAFAKSAE